MTSRTAHVSRADLLRLIDRRPADEQEALAALVGFEPSKPPPEQTRITAGTDVAIAQQPFTTPEPEPEPKPMAQAVTFWRVVAYEAQQPREINPDVPGWLQNEKPIAQGASEIPVYIQAREGETLLHWPRLLGFLRAHLIIQRASQLPDERRLVRLIAKARPYNRIPRKTYRRWPQQVVVVLDQSQALYPLWRDFFRLKDRLQTLLGAGLKLIRVDSQATALPEEFDALLAAAGLSPEALVSARLLILSDAGAAETQTRRANYWQAFLRWLTRHPLKRPPLALITAPAAYWWAGLGQLTDAAFWDRDSPLHLSQGAALQEKGKRPDLSRLLAMLSMAAEARPRLLRSMRLLLTDERHDVSWEIAAWNHPDVLYFIPECYLHPKHRKSHQAEFLNSLKSADRQGAADNWPRKALQAIAREHQGAPDFIRDQERALSYAAEKQPDEAAGFIGRAILALRDSDSGSERERLSRWARQFISTTDSRFIASNEQLGALRVMVNRERAARGGEIQEQDTKFDYLFAEKPEREHILWQQGTGWGSYLNDETDVQSSGSPIGMIRSQDSVIRVEPATGAGETMSFWKRGTKPVWAHDWGQDEFGRWSEFRIENKRGEPITQRLRWIEPGRFTMGSPAEEAERESDEIPHEVILTQGYWLADAATTQALWKAVIGDNPSKFKGAEHPVEQVSWEGVATFISGLNERVPGLGLRLPTEAEWEYACRAGTKTPFWFGEKITTEQANFNGNYPYADGKKEKYRKRTVEVKALPCNGWGFYQMHGNVWEWCSDWYSEYPAEAVQDPQGPERGERRVLRGGGWVGDGGSARSAQRFHDAPDYRYDDIGFRLARGQSGAEPAGPQAAHQAERWAAAGRTSVAAVPRLGTGVMAEPPSGASARQPIVISSDRERLILEPITKPDWADAIGRDRYGLFADFSVLDVSQRMRWINPGRFMMGSPEGEADRSENERQHEVTLSKGYWLADTACTQALWQVVMAAEPGMLKKILSAVNPNKKKDGNPSHFSGVERPVEQVSWDEVMAFIARLNAQAQGLDLRLPTEAEWEYACRAGTRTSFWFGENITTEQVNFDGPYPYAGGAKGESRGETVEVKALPCNGWGLYQMHGNVWEWCSDWYGEYSATPVQDPQGPASGAGRVLRGGSWVLLGRDARSAQRIHDAPDYRIGLIGFRLARGQ